VTGAARRERDTWHGDIGSPPEDDYQAFLAVLRFRTSYDEKTDLLERLEDRLRANGLRRDRDALEAGIEQVRQWVIKKKRRVTRDDVEAAVKDRNLRAGPPEPPSVTLWVHTVRRLPADDSRYELDWRHAFEGTDRERGHELLDPDDWNGRLLPELEAIADRIETENGARLLRVRGLARLSPWFAVGYTFRETAGWAIETSQYGKLWRTNDPASDDAITVSPVDELAGESALVAVSIGVTGDPTADVRRYLEASGHPAGRLVSIRTPRSGNEAIRDGGDLVRLASVVKGTLQSLRPKARSVLLFYFGPASGAVFIGHRLNAVADEIQLHELRSGNYLPSFRLR
jgi:hypothetical protein